MVGSALVLLGKYTCNMITVFLYDGYIISTHADKGGIKSCSSTVVLR